MLRTTPLVTAGLVLAIFATSFPPNVLGMVGFMVHIVSAPAADLYSVAIDHCGWVYRWGKQNPPFEHFKDMLTIDREPEKIPVLVLSLRFSRVVQVVARSSNFVLLDNGTVHCLGGSGTFKKLLGRSYAVLGDKAHSVDCGWSQAVVVTKKGTILGLMDNYNNLLGVDSTIPIQVFAEVTPGFKTDVQVWEPQLKNDSNLD